MRIAFVLGRFPVGSETFILSQITGLIDRGHDVEIFADRPQTHRQPHADVIDYELLDKTHYWPSVRAASSAQKLFELGESMAAKAGRVPRIAARAVGPTGPEKMSARLLWHAWWLGHPRRFDAIISHFGHVARHAQALRDVGVLAGKLVTVFHAYDLTVYLRKSGPDAYTHLFESGDLFLPISQHWQNRITELGCPTGRSAVHHMGIDCDRFEYRSRRPADGSLRVISVARFVEKKGIYYAIRAVGHAIVDNPDADIEYHIVGDGELRRDLESLVEQLELGDHVRFRGWRTQDEVAALLNEMNLFVAPSVTALNADTEGIPMVLMEAMARGLGVLSTYHSGIPELIEDGVNGMLVSERDIAGLADKLQWAIDHPDRLEAMGRAGRATVEKDFNINRLNDRLESRLARLVSDSHD